MKFGLVRQRLDDDLMHEAETTREFNESVYYNFGDVGQDIGGLLRLGNRVNEGYAEMTTCLFLPDHSVAFWYARPPIADNRAHDAGGLRCETIEPHVEHRVTYDGPVLRMKDPAEMENPSRAFKTNPHEDCHVELVFRGVSPTYWPWVPAEGGEAEGGDDGMNALVAGGFARNHLNQHMSVSGLMSMGSEDFTVGDGLGWRDRSWGPRSWQHVAWYRWASCSFGPDFGLAIIVFGDEDGSRSPRGYVHRGRTAEPVRIVDADFDTTYDDRWYTQAVRLTVETEGGDRHLVEGDVCSHIPLRFPNKQTGQMTRVTEGMTRWTCDGQPGVGLLEYLDQMHDSRPVGVGR
jgi:hypothetical protein